MGGWMCKAAEAKGGLKCPGTEVADDCDSPFRCWEFDLGPLKAQWVILVVEPSPVQERDLRSMYPVEW